MLFVLSTKRRTSRGPMLFPLQHLHVQFKPLHVQRLELIEYGE